MDSNSKQKLKQETIDELKQEKARTGVGVAKLLRGTNQSRPDGLTANIINGWLRGTSTEAKPTHIKWVMDRYKNWKEPISITELKPAKIIITDILLNQLQKEAKRTGLGAIDILRHAPKPLPDGLNHQKVQRWISGDTRTAIKPHWDLVLLLYAKVLD